MSFTSNQRNHLCWQMWVKKFKNLKDLQQESRTACIHVVLNLQNCILKTVCCSLLDWTACLIWCAWAAGPFHEAWCFICQHSVVAAESSRCCQLFSWGTKEASVLQPVFSQPPYKKKKKRKKKGSLCRSVGLDQILMIAHSRRNQSSSADYSSILKEGTWSQPSTWGKKIKLKFCSLPFI